MDNFYRSPLEDLHDIHPSILALTLSFFRLVHLRHPPTAQQGSDGEAARTMSNGAAYPEVLSSAENTGSRAPAATAAPGHRLKITVCDPVKQDQGINAYITYKVLTDCTILCKSFMYRVASRLNLRSCCADSEE